MFRFVIIIIFITSCHNLNAASFDCSQKGLIRAEKLTCDNPRLSSMDDVVNNLYKVVTNDNFSWQFYRVNSGEIKEGQIEWIKVKNSCVTEECIFEKYLQRINYLSILIEEMHSARSKKFIVDVFTREFESGYRDGFDIDVDIVFHYSKSTGKSTYVAQIDARPSSAGGGPCAASQDHYLIYFEYDRIKKEILDKKYIARGDCFSEYNIFSEAYRSRFENKVSVGYRSDDKKIIAFTVSTHYDDYVEFERVSDPPSMSHWKNAQKY
jgi:uncharacterized protein